MQKGTATMVTTEWSFIFFLFFFYQAEVWNKTRKPVTPNFFFFITKMSSMQLPPQNDFDATWAFLEDGLDQVMCRFEQGLTRARYSILYR